MLKDFILPDIGEGIVECEIVEWLVNEGDLIEEDQLIVEIMTDKAVVQIPAADSGKMSKFYHQQGEIAKVHQPLFAIEIEAPEQKETPAPPQEISISKTKTHAEENIPLPSPSQAVSLATEGFSRKALATPAVRKLGRELNLDLRKVSGSGKNGRVLKEDLENYQTSSLPAKIEGAKVGIDGSRVEPLKGVRLAMARRMAAAVSTIPHFAYGDEIDLTQLVRLRDELKAELKEAGVHLTLLSFFMKALALALREYPLLNSRLNSDVTEIIYQDNCNIGLAVDTPIGLLVPNIKNVQNLSILEIAKETQRLTQAAREGKVAQKDMQGGTITLSNIGAIGGTFGIPIINPPEVAVAALSKIQTLPRYNSEGSVKPRKIMQANWSADHRIIDGGTIARFSNLWKKYLEEPSMMLIHLT